VLKARAFFRFIAKQAMGEIIQPLARCFPCVVVWRLYKRRMRPIMAQAGDGLRVKAQPEHVAGLCGMRQERVNDADASLVSFSTAHRAHYAGLYEDDVLARIKALVGGNRRDGNVDGVTLSRSGRKCAEFDVAHRSGRGLSGRGCVRHFYPATTLRFIAEVLVNLAA